MGSTRPALVLAPNPRWYQRVWHLWQRFARALGNLFSRVVTSLVYIVVIPIFAIGVRLFSDPLRLKPGPAHWAPMPPAPADLEEARRGF